MLKAGGGLRCASSEALFSCLFSDDGIFDMDETKRGSPFLIFSRDIFCYNKSAKQLEIKKSFVRCIRPGYMVICLKERILRETNVTDDRKELLYG